MEPHPVSLSTSFIIRDECIEICYSVKNNGNSDVGLFNAIGKADAQGNLTYDPSNVYTSIQEMTLWVRKVVLPAPRSRILRRVVPGITRLQSGATLSEEVRLRIPIVPYDPYAFARPSAEGPEQPNRAVNQVILEIGYFTIVKGIKLQPVAPKFPDILRSHPADLAIDNQTILASQISLGSSIPVFNPNPL